MSNTPEPDTAVEGPAKDELYALDASGLKRRTSSFSQNNGNCVEVASFPEGGRVLTDSKRPDRNDLRFTPAEWKAFIAGVKAGEFD
ncbi:DUF397 domain-containing protein [Streptomyces sp. NRRL S-350]|uniref:DUF397 domain-containing protein n=1 Tax=Streptomyces sp. NRRL S-350 TaxID=1463902 RepID=UPI00099D0B3E|nr:DUF397 domain-containing protein [Streptomyces sp. NRRL S-350]